jgi:hypothetical protein
MHSYRPESTTLSAHDLPAQLSRHGVAAAAANYLGQYLGNVQQQIASSLLTPQTASPLASQLQQPLGHTGLVPQSGGTTLWHQPDSAVSQALRIAQFLGVQSATNYLGYLISPESRQDLMNSHGYGRVTQLTASAADNQRIVNDPYVMQLSGQWIHNGVVDYTTDRYGLGGVHATNWMGMAQDFGVQSGHLNQLWALPGMQPSRPQGTGSGSPFVDMLGAPIGSNPADRYTYNGSQAYTPSGWSTGNSYGMTAGYTAPSVTVYSLSSYGLPYGSNGVYQSSGSQYNYGNVYANAWNYY